jgi:hypothetical protein
MSLDKFPTLVAALAAAKSAPMTWVRLYGMERSNAYDQWQQIQDKASAEIGSIWNNPETTPDDKVNIQKLVPEPIMTTARAFYGVKIGNAGPTNAEHGGRRRKTKKSKRRSRKIRRGNARKSAENSSSC